MQGDLSHQLPLVIKYSTLTSNLLSKLAMDGKVKGTSFLQQPHTAMALLNHTLSLQRARERERERKCVYFLLLSL